MADQEVKKEIWKQQQLLDYLQEGLELGVENAGHAEIQEAYLEQIVQLLLDDLPIEIELYIYLVYDLQI